MGPHESFEINGDYLLSCGSIHSPTFIYTGDDNQVHYDGNFHRKSRIVILNADIRVMIIYIFLC